MYNVILDCSHMHARLQKHKGICVPILLSLEGCYCTCMKVHILLVCMTSLAFVD